MRFLIVLVVFLRTVLRAKAGEGWFCKSVGEIPQGEAPIIIGNQVFLKNLKRGTFSCFFEGKEIYTGEEKGFVLSLQGGKSGLNMVGVATRSEFMNDTAFCDGHFYDGDIIERNRTIQKYFGDAINLAHSEKEDIYFRVDKRGDHVSVYLKHLKVSLGKAFDFNADEGVYPVVCLSENATATFEDLEQSKVYSIPQHRDESTPRGTYQIETYFENGAPKHMTCKHPLRLTTVYYGITHTEVDLLYAEKLEIGFGNNQVLGYIKFDHKNPKWSYLDISHETGPCINFVNEMLKSEFEVYYPASEITKKLMYIDVATKDKRKSFRAPNPMAFIS